jgi:hypothetical protein
MCLCVASRDGSRSNPEFSTALLGKAEVRMQSAAGRKGKNVWRGPGLAEKNGFIGKCDYI